MNDNEKEKIADAPSPPDTGTGLATIESGDLVAVERETLPDSAHGGMPSMADEAKPPEEYHRVTDYDGADYDDTLGGGYASVKGKKIGGNRTLWIVVALMSVLCIAVGVLSSVLTGYFMRRGTTPPKINTTGKYEQTAAVIEARKKCVVEVSSVGISSLRGSGVIMKLKNDEIYIMTNYHVLGGASVVNVRFDGSDDYWQAEVAGYDPYYDIAVVTVPASVAPYTVYELDGSEYFSAGAAFREGDLVVAIGNAMGYGLAAYDGIISRSYELIDYSSNGLSKVVPVLRTTAAVNAGMSGGALFDSEGRFVGLSTYRLSNSSSDPNAGSETDVEDTAFVTPVAIVEPVYRQILEYAEGGNVGVSSMMTLFKSNTSAIGGITFYFDGAGGFTAEYRDGRLTVTSLNGGSPLGGIAVGDIIVSVGSGGAMKSVTGNICATVGAFLHYRRGGSGGQLKIGIERDGEPRTVGVSGYGKAV